MSPKVPCFKEERRKNVYFGVPNFSPCLYDGVSLKWVQNFGFGYPVGI